MIYFESKNAVIHYDLDKKLVEIKWKSVFSSQQEYRLIITKALVVIKQHNIENWISDVSQKKVFLDEERLWVENFIVPHACANGLKKLAFILNTKIYKKFDLTPKWRSCEDNKLCMRLFGNRKQAIDWIIDKKVCENQVQDVHLEL